MTSANGTGAEKADALRAAVRRRRFREGELETQEGRCPFCGGPLAPALGVAGPVFVCWCVVPRVYPRRCAKACHLCGPRRAAKGGKKRGGGR